MASIRSTIRAEIALLAVALLSPFAFHVFAMHAKVQTPDFHSGGSLSNWGNEQQLEVFYKENMRKNDKSTAWDWGRQCTVNDGGSYPGTLVQRCGGVGRNHADALTRLGVNVQLISALGDDPQGEYIRTQCAHMDLSNVITVNGVQTATHATFTVKGNVQYGISSIERIIERITPDLIRTRESLISDADFVVLDGNVPVETINAVVTIADFYGTKVWYEPTDILKMRKIFDAGIADKIDVTSPNVNEFFAYCNLIDQKLPEEYLEKGKARAMFDHIWENAERYMRCLDALVLTVGPEGTLVLKKDGGKVGRHQLDAPLLPEVVVSPSGAGDCFNSGLLGGRLFGWTIDESLRLAQRCAAASLQSIEAVPHSINDLCPQAKN